MSSQYDGLAGRLRGFGPLGILAILLIVFSGSVPAGSLGGMPILMPLGAVLVLVWARLSRTPWHEIGYVRSKGWIASLAVGLVFGVVLKFLMKALVMPLLGAAPINQTYSFLTGNSAALPAAVWSMTVSAGFGEETVFRGYLFERFGKLFGSGAGVKVWIVAITSIWFGLVHYSSQGLAGAEQAGIAGLVLGVIFAVTGRIFLPMVAHAAFDLTALAIIYWNLETRVAHLVMR
jgi:uncharacterized protein